MYFLLVVIIKILTMKRLGLLCVVVAFFTVSNVNAQLRFGVKMGANVANASFSKDVLKTSNVTGFQFGPSIEAMAGRGGIGFDLSVLYSQKGFNANKEKVKNDYLEVPLNLKFKLGMPLLNPFVSFGPYASVRVNGDDEWSFKENAANVVDQVKTKSFGAGMNFMLGADFFDRLQLGITYGWGLTDDYKSFDKNKIDSYMGKVKTWQITGAYYFKMKKK